MIFISVMIGNMQDQDIYLLVGLVFLASLVIGIALYLLTSLSKAPKKKKKQRSPAPIANQEHEKPKAEYIS